MSKIELYRKMYMIRETEKAIESYFEKGVMRGTTHGCIGQEAIAVGVLDSIDLEKDFVTSGHRCHGHYLAVTEDILGLAGELMGKNIGVINGKGASQHIHYKNFYTNGITGGMIPVAVGMGLAKKLKSEEGVVVSFLGDGAMNEGYVMEALNLSKVYETPNIYILENNKYAMSTETELYTGASFKKRVEGFGIKYEKLIAKNVLEIQEKFEAIYKYVNKNKAPYFIEFETFRFCGHSKSDKKDYFDKEIENYWKNIDPLETLKEKLIKEDREKVEREVKKLVQICFEKALNSEEPDKSILDINIIG